MFQQNVRYDFAFGQPGEIKYDGPKRFNSGSINSASAAYNIVGATAYTQPAAGGAFVAGGTGNFAGILANPKVYASIGTTALGPLGPTLTLPNQVQAEFAMMAELVVSVPAACNIGDLLTYSTTTGALATVAPIASYTGVVSTNVLTVSGMSATGNLGVGSIGYAANGAILYRILSLGTGTGGNGTYNVDTVTVASQAVTSNSEPPAGFAFVPNATIEKFPQSGAGLAVARLTN